MMKIPASMRGVVRAFSLAAAAILVLSALPDQRAEALSLINPAAAPAAKHVSDGLTTEVRGGHGGGGGGHGGGGGGFHGGGGFRSGAAIHSSGSAVFRGGGFRAAHVYRGGGYRYGGYRYGGYRFAHRHHFRRNFYYAPSYYDYPHRYCEVIWTYYGPRRICRYHPWHHHHWRFHRRHHWPIYW